MIRTVPGRPEPVVRESAANHLAMPRGRDLAHHWTQFCEAVASTGLLASR
jgi:hypothetical protein